MNEQFHKRNPFTVRMKLVVHMFVDATKSLVKIGVSVCVKAASTHAHINALSVATPCDDIVLSSHELPNPYAVVCAHVLLFPLGMSDVRNRTRLFERFVFGCRKSWQLFQLHRGRAFGHNTCPVTCGASVVKKGEPEIEIQLDVTVIWSMKKDPGCLGYIYIYIYMWDYTTQFYGDYSKPL